MSQYSMEDVERASRDPGALREDKPPIMRFENGTQEDRSASIEAGRYVHMACINVFVRAAGDRKTEVPYIAEGFAYVTEKGKKTKVVINPWIDQLQERKHHGRISQNYYDSCIAAFERFKAGSDSLEIGTPILGWMQINAAMQMNLRNLGIMTIEMAAEMTEEALQSVGMGARDIKNKAVAFVSTSNTTDTRIDDLQEELSKERNSHNDQMSAMAKKIEELEKKSQKGTKAA